MHCCYYFCWRLGDRRWAVLPHCFAISTSEDESFLITALIRPKTEPDFSVIEILCIFFCFISCKLPWSRDRCSASNPTRTYRGTTSSSTTTTCTSCIVRGTQILVLIRSERRWGRRQKRWLLWCVSACDVVSPNCRYQTYRTIDIIYT